MDIKRRLEQEHSKQLNREIIRYVGDNRQRLEELLSLLFGDDALLSQRAAWSAGDLGAEHPELFLTYIPELISRLRDRKAHPAVRRNILRIFSSLEIPEEHQSAVLDICLAFIRSEAEPVAVRAFAVTLAATISRPYAELRAELLMLLREISSVPHSPAMNVRIKRALKDISPGKAKF